MQPHTLFNFLEAMFWMILAGVCVMLSFYCRVDFRKLYTTAYVLLLLFGCSDIVEIIT